MAYYLLTVLEQDSGAEVQRCVKDLHICHVRSFKSFQALLYLLLNFFAPTSFPSKDDGKVPYTLPAAAQHTFEMHVLPGSVDETTAVRVEGVTWRSCIVFRLTSFCCRCSWQRHQVLQSPEVQDAMRVVRAWRSRDFVVFFRALRQQRITHRCLLAQYVATMRHTAIQVSLKFSQ